MSCSEQQFVDYAKYDRILPAFIYMYNSLSSAIDSLRRAVEESLQKEQVKDPRKAQERLRKKQKEGIGEKKLKSREREKIVTFPWSSEKTWTLPPGSVVRCSAPLRHSYWLPT